MWKEQRDNLIEWVREGNTQKRRWLPEALMDPVCGWCRGSLGELSADPETPRGGWGRWQRIKSKDTGAGFGTGDCSGGGSIQILYLSKSNAITIPCYKSKFSIEKHVSIIRKMYFESNLQSFAACHPLSLPPVQPLLSLS